MINYLVIILLAICGVYGNKPDQTIIASPGQFNYFVMIWHCGEFRCGGTIIDEKHIITRGTCVMNTPSSDLTIIAGIADSHYTEKPKFSVKSIHIHYGFKPKRNVVMSGETHWVHDIAVLKLVNPMVWNRLTAPAVLITEEYSRNVKLDCVVPGWRHTHRDKASERYYIRWIKAITRTNKECTAFGVNLLKNEKCAEWAKIRTTNVIQHYNGSPIVHGNTVIGIVDGRMRGDFYAFLNLLPYKDFIANAIDVRKDDVSPGKVKYVVSIWDRDIFKCGGIILDTSHILTTGYCVRYANQTNLQVIAGHTQLLKNNRQIRWLAIAAIAIHPDYEEIILVDGPRNMLIKNNYAVLKLATPLDWSRTISSAPLPPDHSVFTDQICRALRWHNAYAVNHKLLLQLVWSEEYLAEPIVCQSARIDLQPDEICVSSVHAQHPRDLDSSGNPVVCAGFVIGIISPYFSSVQQSCFTSILSIWPCMNFVNKVNFKRPIQSNGPAQK